MNALAILLVLTSNAGEKKNSSLSPFHFLNRNLVATAHEIQLKVFKGHWSAQAKRLLSASEFSFFEVNSEIILHAFTHSLSKNVYYISF
jgi:hypothetical protein